jgi:hypothetical protein
MMDNTRPLTLLPYCANERVRGWRKSNTFYFPILPSDASLRDAILLGLGIISDIHFILIILIIVQTVFTDNLLRIGRFCRYKPIGRLMLLQQAFLKTLAATPCGERLGEKNQA